MTSFIQTLAVAEYLSFHQAALALGTSQSSVSARIKALEADLGITLFDRNTRGVRLTDAGRRFVDQVRDAVGIIDHAIKTAGMLVRVDEGELLIGVHALIAGCFLDNLLRQFHINHPSIRLNLAECTALDAQLMVREGRLDLAFMACTHEISDLNSRVIWSDRLMVALPVRHPLTRKTDVAWRELADEIFLVRQNGPGPQIYDLIVARSAGKWAIPTILRLQVGRDTLLSMIAAWHGISLLVADLVVPSTANVEFLPVRDEPEAIPFSIVWSPRNRDPALSNLLALATEMGCSRPKPDSR